MKMVTVKFEGSNGEWIMGIKSDFMPDFYMLEDKIRFYARAEHKIRLGLKSDFMPKSQILSDFMSTSPPWIPLH